MMSADDGKEPYFDGPHLSPTGSRSPSTGLYDKSFPHRQQSFEPYVVASRPQPLQNFAAGSSSDEVDPRYGHQPPPALELHQINGLQPASGSSNLEGGDVATMFEGGHHPIMRPPAHQATVNHEQPSSPPHQASATVNHYPSLLVPRQHESRFVGVASMLENNEAAGCSQHFGSYMNIANSVDPHQPRTTNSILQVGEMGLPSGFSEEEAFNPPVEFCVDPIHPTQDLHQGFQAFAERRDYDDILHSQGTWSPTTYATTSSDYITQNSSAQGGDLPPAIPTADGYFSGDQVASSSPVVDGNLLNEEIEELNFADKSEPNQVESAQAQVATNEVSLSPPLDVDLPLDVQPHDLLDTPTAGMQSNIDRSEEVGQQAYTSSLHPYSVPADQSDTSSKVMSESLSSLSSVFASDPVTAAHSKCVPSSHALPSSLPSTSSIPASAEKDISTKSHPATQEPTAPTSGHPVDVLSTSTFPSINDQANDGTRAFFVAGPPPANPVVSLAPSGGLASNTKEIVGTATDPEVTQSSYVSVEPQPGGAEEPPAAHLSLTGSSRLVPTNFPPSSQPLHSQMFVGNRSTSEDGPITSHQNHSDMTSSSQTGYSDMHATSSNSQHRHSDRDEVKEDKPHQERDIATLSQREQEQKSFVKPSPHNSDITPIISSLPPGPLQAINPPPSGPPFALTHSEPHPHNPVPRQTQPSVVSHGPPIKNVVAPRTHLIVGPESNPNPTISTQATSEHSGHPPPRITHEQDTKISAYPSRGISYRGNSPTQQHDSSNYAQRHEHEQQWEDRRTDNIAPPRPSSRSSAAGSESHHPSYNMGTESYNRSYHDHTSAHGGHYQHQMRRSYWSDQQPYNQRHGNRWAGDQWSSYDPYYRDQPSSYRGDGYGRHYGYNNPEYYDYYRRSYYDRGYYSRGEVGYGAEYRGQPAHYGPSQYEQVHQNYPSQGQAYTGASSRHYEEEDNRSVYSDRSYHERYDPNYNRSYRPDGSRYVEDPSLSHSYYSGYPEEDSWHQLPAPQVQSRQTPRKFTAVHPVARFGAGGHLILVLPQRLVESRSSAVEIHSVETLLHKCPEAEALRLFPGPLSRDETHKNDVARFIAARSRSSSLNTELIDRLSTALVWDFLGLLVRQNGSVMGTDIAELLMQGHSGDFALLASPNDALTQENKTISPSAANNTVNESTVSPDEATLVNTSPSTRFRELLLYGRKKDALEWAMKSDLWGHALLLASKMDARTHATVMLRFANSLPINDPLQTLYQLMSGRQPASTTCVAEEGWGDWRPHLAMILSNETSNISLHTRVAMTMGDTLMTQGLIDAAHFCYLMTSTPLGYYTRKSSKIVLLGSSHLRSFNDFASSDAIERTETYEYAISLSASTQQQRPGSLSLPSLQLYKFLYACRLRDYGMTAKAFHYCENISKLIIQTPHAYSVTLVSQLSNMVESLRYHDSRAKAGTLHDSDLHWIEALHNICGRMQGGSIAPNTASFTHSSAPSMTSSDHSDPHDESDDDGDSVEQEPYNEPHFHHQQPSQCEVVGPITSQQDVTLHPPASVNHVNFYDPNHFQAEPSHNMMPQHSQVNEALSQASMPTLPAPREHQPQTTDNLQPMQPPLSDEQHNQRNVDFYGQLSSVPQVLQTRERTVSQTSHGSRRSRRSRKSSGRRSRTTSENSRRSRSASDESEKPQKKQEKPAKRWSLISWLRGSEKPQTNRMHLPDDSNKQITWDPDRKRWVDVDGTEEKETPLAPPPVLNPTDPAAPSASGDGSSPPTMTSNRFSLKNLNSRTMYKDAFGGVKTSTPKHTPPPSVFPAPVQGNPAMFTPEVTPESSVTPPDLARSLVPGEVAAPGNPQPTQSLQPNPPMMANSTHPQPAQHVPQQQAPYQQQPFQPPIQQQPFQPPIQQQPTSFQQPNQQQPFQQPNQQQPFQPPNQQQPAPYQQSQLLQPGQQAEPAKSAATQPTPPQASATTNPSAPAVALFYNPAQFTASSNPFSQPPMRGRARGRGGYPRPKQ
ncbi:uncharacterized protein LOC143468458 isoform X2 [Clavelina lepadiformis]|uniref:uncharacterized protein LOC143468458 isoform X2 n=1 Tax=Clavelina lepadiformis TaxID=159417 RepID=UPI0040434F01